MAISAGDIILTIEKLYPKDSQPFKNYADVKFHPKVQTLNQFILGIAASDVVGTDINQYEHSIKNALQNISKHVNCLAWSFDIEELQQVKLELKKLAEYYEIDLDVETLIAQTIRMRNQQHRYFIVVTVVQCLVVGD